MKIKASDINEPPKNYRDVTSVGHFGTGDSEFQIRNAEDFEIAKVYLQIAYQKVGG